MEGAAPVYGNCRARWFRGGQYFDGQGNPLSAADAGKPEFEEAVEPVEVEETVPSYCYGPAVVPPVVDNPVVIEPVTVIRESRLADMKPAAISQLVRLAGGKPATGKGSRAENVRWLLDNTTD